MSTISTHVLDVSLGKPAANVPVLIERVRDTQGDTGQDLRDVTIGAGTTDSDGRLRDFLTAGGALTQGVYRLRFDVAQYFRITSRETFYPEIAVLFRVRAGDEHYHVPVLISPFGYSTYRGT